MLYDLICNLSIGLIMILTTFIFHAFALDRLYHTIQGVQPHLQHLPDYSPNRQMTLLLLTALGIITIHSFEIWFWALTYDYFDIHALKNLEESLYFSTVSFSTVGYGDVVLDPGWRLLGAMQAASGMILFGWSTAFILEIMSFTYPRRFTHKKQDD
jgi:voltage-gated potassium channel